MILRIFCHTFMVIGTGGLWLFYLILAKPNVGKLIKAILTFIFGSILLLALIVYILL